MATWIEMVEMEKVISPGAFENLPALIRLAC